MARVRGHFGRQARRYYVARSVAILVGNPIRSHFRRGGLRTLRGPPARECARVAGAAHRALCDDDAADDDGGGGEGGGEGEDSYAIFFA